IGEYKRKRYGRFHNWLYGDTYHLVADDGKKYNLIGEPDPLYGGERYRILSPEESQAVFEKFFAANGKQPRQPAASFGDVVAKSPQGQDWDFKAKAGYGLLFTTYSSSTLLTPDYAGNMMWGEIMASHGWNEGVALGGAGAFQALEAFVLLNRAAF